jgi:cell wall-associated NlpC family hydrolase
LLLRTRSVTAIICSLTISAVGASSALAASTGGVSAAPSAPAAPVTPEASTPAIHLDPVTSSTTNIAYSGPVYEKNAAGEVVPYAPPVPAAQVGSTTGGSPVGETASDTSFAIGASDTTSPIGAEPKPELLVPGTIARYVDGLAAAPMSVPLAVQEIIWAGNQLIGLPYIYGGGHDASFISPGYDCSGTVSFALHGASLLTSPEDSSEFEAWGSHGAGRYVTIFANGGHAYMTVAGLRLDTSPANDPSNLEGPRWRPLRPGNAGFVVRHPLGL